MKNETLIDIDWRARVVDTLVKDAEIKNGTKLRKGAAVKLRTIVTIGDKDFTFLDPSASALFLNRSYLQYQQSKEIYPTIINSDVDKDKEISSKIFNYFEAICSSIVFAYIGIESYVNEEIPDGFEVLSSDLPNNTHKDVEVYDKEDIERFISLPNKIDIILPRIFYKKSPKGKKIWEDFIFLQRLRNRIVHLKTEDREASKISNKYPDNIWNELLQPKQKNFPAIAKAIIIYFGSNTGNHWLNHFPF